MVRKIITEKAVMAERLTQAHSPGRDGCGWEEKETGRSLKVVD